MPRLPQRNYTTKAGESNEKDRCQSPDYALDPLLPYLLTLQQRLSRQLIVWEPAAGEGLLAGYLEAAGFQVITGDILTGQDYFADSSVPANYDVQVTNVPFSRKYHWLKRAIRLGKPFGLLMPSVVMFNRGGILPISMHQIEIVSPMRRIDFKMPNIGWGADGKKSQSQFHSSWFTRQLGVGQNIVYVELLKGKARERAQLQPLLAGMEG